MPILRGCLYKYIVYDDYDIVILRLCLSTIVLNENIIYSMIYYVYVFVTSPPEGVARY